MTTVWRVRIKYSFAIERVLATKVTDKSIFISGGRVARVADGIRYFDSLDEAKQSALATIQKKLTAAESTLQELREWQKAATEATEQTVPESDARW